MPKKWTILIVTLIVVEKVNVIPCFIVLFHCFLQLVNRKAPAWRGLFVTNPRRGVTTYPVSDQSIETVQSPTPQGLIQFFGHWRIASIEISVHQPALRRVLPSRISTLIVYSADVTQRVVTYQLIKLWPPNCCKCREHDIRKRNRSVLLERHMAYSGAKLVGAEIY
jgi:hypothetical protein